jgi:uncharacterized lipoprotein YehR (DUF1307 family)
LVAFRRTAFALVALTLALTLAGCGDDAQSPSSADDPASSASSSSALSAIACATGDPTGVGELTGAWEGSEGGTYYIRQVGECVWWFGTEIDDFRPG